jgi:hypothetical protein
MPDLSDLFELHEAKPIGIGSQKVIVISKALRLQVPGVPVGFVWNRPAAVRVQTEGAGEVTLPVTDETRRLQILLLAIGIIGSILIAALFQRS